MNDMTVTDAAMRLDDRPELRRTTSADSDAPEQDRPARPAMIRGWQRKCPNCGTGPIFKGYLATNEACPICREDLTGHRADDGPAYLTILIVGHIMAPMLLVVFEAFRPEPLTLFTIFAVGVTALALYLLPRLKGAIIGLQWARRLYGFAGPDASGDEPEGR